MSSTAILELRNQHLDVAAELLAETFVDDAGIRYICGDNREYQRRAKLWFSATLRMVMKNQQVIRGLFDNERLIALTAISLPGFSPSPGDLLHWSIAIGRQTGWRTVLRTFGHVQQIENLRPAAPHFTLEFIAVSPEYQGQGYARLLLNQLHDDASKDGTVNGIWLETTNTVNVGLYEYFGYRLQHRIQYRGYEIALMFYDVTET